MAQRDLFSPFSFRNGVRARNRVALAPMTNLHDDKLLPGLTRLAASLRERGAVSLAQLFHGGARASSALTGARVWSASENPDDPASPREATVEDIERIIASFRDAAVLAFVAD